MYSATLYIVSIILAYLIGSIPVSYIVTKAVKGIDIRQSGSGNAGATNVLRVVGRVPAVITLVADIFKGFFVVTLLADFIYSYGMGADRDLYRASLALAVVSGHIWPVFLKFKGGKGVATTIGVALGIAPLIFLPSLAVWVAVFFLSKYVSLASIIALISFPVIAAASGANFYTTLAGIIICSVSIYKHKSNISRLLNGEENKTNL